MIRKYSTGLMVTLCASTSVLILLAPAAQARQETAAKVDAKGLFDTGTTALRSGRFAEARDLFRASLQRRPHPATAFNLAVALRGTGEVLSALQTFDALLAGKYGPLSEARRREVARFRATVATEVATLQIQATGAPRVTIRVDGIKRGTVLASQRLRLSIDPGPHVVTARAPGTLPIERKVSVRRATVVKLDFALQPKIVPGTLLVETSDSGAQLEIVGVAKGVSPLRKKLAPGQYIVRSRGPEGDVEKTVKVVSERWTSVRLKPSRPITSKPWFWTLTGVAVVAGVIATIFVATRPRDPVEDPIFGNTYTLGR